MEIINRRERRAARGRRYAAAQWYKLSHQWRLADRQRNKLSDSIALGHRRMFWASI